MRCDVTPPVARLRAGAAGSPLSVVAVVVVVCRRPQGGDVMQVGRCVGLKFGVVYCQTGGMRANQQHCIAYGNAVRSPACPLPHGHAW